MGLIFVTAGEAIVVTCGSAKAPNLPEWAKLLCVLVLPIQAGLPVCFSCPQATLRSPCGYENSAFQAVFCPFGQFVILILIVQRYIFFRI
jgi:hypothetical protein